MGKINHKGLYGVLEGMIAAAAALTLLLLTLMCLTGRAYMPMTWKERIVFRNNGVFFYLALIAAAAALIAGFRLISKISDKIVFLICNAVFGAAGLFLIVNAPAVLRADAGNVYAAAVQFNDGNYAMLGFGRYLYVYPHQLGLATLWRPFAAAGLGVHGIFTFNLLMAFTANFALWQSARLVYGENRAAVNYICIMQFLFFPHLFFILFAYGTTSGLCLICLAVYFAVKYLKGKGRAGGILCVLFASLSCVVRNNNEIGVIAIGVGFALYAVRDKKPALLVYPAAMLAAAVLSLSLVKWGYAMESKMPVGEGMPKTLWTAMGLQDNDSRMDGWSNAYNEQTYLHCHYDGREASAKAAADIRERLGYFAANPDKAYRFFKNKLCSTWTEPTFQSLWSGPLSDCGQTVKTSFLKNLYGGGAGYDALNGFGSVITALIYGSALAGLIFRFAARRKIGFFGCVTLMYLVGGFLFHLVWETKSQYVYPYVYLLIPFAMGSIAELAKAADARIAGKIFRKKNDNQTSN